MGQRGGIEAVGEVGEEVGLDGETQRGEGLFGLHGAVGGDDVVIHPMQQQGGEGVVGDVLELGTVHEAP